MTSQCRGCDHQVEARSRHLFFRDDAEDSGTWAAAALAIRPCPIAEGAGK